MKASLRRRLKALAHGFGQDHVKVAAAMDALQRLSKGPDGYPGYDADKALVATWMAEKDSASEMVLNVMAD